VNLKLTTMVNSKRSSKCNIIASRIEGFYSNAIGMTSLTKESEYPHYGLVEINLKARLRNVNDVFIFAKQCQYTPSFRKDRSRVDWLSVLKQNPRVVSRLFRMRTKTQVCEMKSFKLVSWLNHIELLL
jgi:hypothetical protein